MSANRKFTEEEMELLRNNPNIASVSPTALSYSLAFKKKAIEAAANGMTSIKFFTSEELGPSILGKPRIYSAMKAFKKEAASPEGLHEPHGKSREARMEAFAKEELAKKKTKIAIRELQDKVVHLEQQIEFLKKTRFPQH